MTNIEIIVVEDESLKNTAFGPSATCKNIYKSLLKLYPNVKTTICTDEHDLKDVVGRNPDLVLLTNKIIIDSHGDKIWLSEYFETNNINYTGSSKEVLKYDVNKTSSKLQILSHNIETAGFFTVIPNQYKSPEEIPIPFPLFIKPNNSANSDGIDINSFAINFAGFQSKVKELYDIYKEPILVEEYLSGREFTVSIIDSDTMLVAPIEIIAPLKNDLRILSQKIKSEDSEILKKITDINIYQKVSDIALNAFKALGARDFGRIDIKMDAHERCYFVEANLTPGMTRGSSYFPNSYELCSLLKYEEIINLIVRSAIKRFPIRK
jgi:D-alanine-D-alanine ligase